MQLAQLDEGGPELIVEDSAGEPDAALAAMDRLVTQSGVIAVLGPVSSRAAEAAARSARSSGVPLMAFSASEDVTDAGDEVFRLLYSPREEIAALVADARSRGLTRFVILYPDHGYGRTMERLFDQEVASAGGVACEGVAYPPGTKSLIDHVSTILETSCDVILLADVADQVAVAAPTFAAEGAWSVLGPTLPEHVERRIHFILPSISWSPSLLERSGRYLQGARITLPFYEADDEPEVVRFRTAYATRYGRQPQTFAAYGYDAYRLISATLRQGNQTREAVREALMMGVSIEPVTSMSAISVERTPAVPPRVYRVEGEALFQVN
jgi:ABC-type branched-subunit amino acid transport system substrate-binding protein